jgi:hypothetical protein
MSPEKVASAEFEPSARTRNQQQGAEHCP